MMIETASAGSKGALLAVAAAALILASCGNGSGHSENAASAGKVHCMGINSCKGTGACQTAANACAGQNACKGQGYLDTTPEECAAKNGTVV
jgi:hypothetical protein